jgi:cobalt-zinc-cadmium efflux system outer membrane protein
LNRGFIIPAGLIWVLAGLGFAGCARFRDHPLSPSQTAKNLEARKLDAPELRRFLETNLSRSIPEWPAKAWDFDMLTLAAIYYHPSLDVARAQWAVAEGGDKTAAQRPNPTLSAVPTYSLTPSSGPSPWTPTVDLNWPIETAGKRKYRMAQARYLSDAARLNIISAAWQVRSDLRKSLSDFAGARKREELLKEQLDLQDRIVRSLEQRLEAGAVASSEVGLVRIAREHVQVDWLDARRVRGEALARVADSIGVTLAALDGLNFPDTVPPVLNAEELTSANLRRLALLGRADILSALSEYAASQAALQLEIAKQYPDIRLDPGYNYDQGNTKISLGLSADLPLLNQNQGPIAEAEAHRTEAAARFNALQAKVINEIDGAIVSYRATDQQLNELDTLAAAQRKQTDAIAGQVKAGAADPLDLLNAQIELSVGELARLDGRVRLEQALGAIEDALQRPVATLQPSLVEQNPRPEAMKETHP